MDSDGTWNKQRTQAVFTNTNTLLLDGVYELVVSLGWKATRFNGSKIGFGVKCDYGYVSFTPPSDNPFLCVKAKNYVPKDSKTAKCTRRMVLSVEPIESVPTQCIGVSSPDNTYLCGDQMIVTHNTGKAPNRFFKEQFQEKLSQVVLYAAAVKEVLHEAPKRARLIFLGKEVINVVPNEREMANKVDALNGTWNEIHTAITTESFEAKTGPLCGWCPYVSICSEGEAHVRKLHADKKIKPHAPALDILGLRDQKSLARS